MDSVPSRVEDILLALINNTEYDGPIISRVEQILYSFLENSEYAAEPESRVEAILVALKAAGLYNDAVISRIEKILYSKLNGTEYTAEPESRVEELLLEWELNEEKELTGVVPLLFNADGEPLLDYLISGNTVQSDTPTPDNPIQPQGTGERTANLFDFPVYRKDINSPNNKKYSIYLPENTYVLSCEVLVHEGRSFGIAGAMYVTSNDTKRYIIPNSSSIDNFVKYSITFTGEITEVGFVGYNYDPSNPNSYVIIKNIQLNTGSTPLPYEPYGYKIPISSANTSTPVYLGEVESTRKIKKLVLTGEEKCTQSVSSLSPNAYCYAFKYSDIGMTDIIYNDENMAKIPYPQYVCSHFKMKPSPSLTQDDSSTNIQDGEIGANSIRRTATGTNITYNRYVILCSSQSTTIGDFKSYLAAQYSAGTPVTIWYVLAEPETAVINEPLMKIGDYADTVSMEQVGAQIPTVNGENTLDVLTTVKPSEVYIKYKGR